MQEILHAFGIDWRLIVIQIFNFSILAGVLWYFLYTPVLKLLSDRETKIIKGIEDADQAAKMRAEADTEKGIIIKEAHTEAGHIFARATAHAEEKEKALNEETQAKIVNDLAQATKLVLELKAKALRESEAEISKLVLLGTEKILNTELAK